MKTRVCHLAVIGLLLMTMLGCKSGHTALQADTTAQPYDKLAERLEGHVRFLAEMDPPRSHKHPESLDRCADYIAEHFRDAGLSVSFQAYEVNGITYRNVIGMRGPVDGPRLVIGAHYDSYGNLPAADDNASGVAGLIESAYLLKGEPLPIAIEFVAYTLEEPPFFGTKNMGSYRHANSLKQAGVDVRAMINYEMIGYFTDEPGSQTYPLRIVGLGRSSVGNFIMVAGRTTDRELIDQMSGVMKEATDLPVETRAALPRLNIVGQSDHQNYWDLGYNAVMVCNTCYLRNKNYHTAKDTPDTLDYVRMAKVVVGTSQAIQVVARED